jgi:hypothetical protein
LQKIKEIEHKELELNSFPSNDIDLERSKTEGSVDEGTIGKKSEENYQKTDPTAQINHLKQKRLTYHLPI